MYLVFKTILFTVFLGFSNICLGEFEEINEEDNEEITGDYNEEFTEDFNEEIAEDFNEEFYEEMKYVFKYEIKITKQFYKLFYFTKFQFYLQSITILFTN